MPASLRHRSRRSSAAPSRSQMKTTAAASSASATFPIAPPPVPSLCSATEGEAQRARAEICSGDCRKRPLMLTGDEMALRSLALLAVLLAFTAAFAAEPPDRPRRPPALQGASDPADVEDDRRIYTGPGAELAGRLHRR